MIPPKIVLDTCVIESAIRSKYGASFRILQGIEYPNLFSFGLSVSLILEYEYRMVAMIDRGQTNLTSNQAESILAALSYYAEKVPIYFKVRPNLRDENDNHVFECCANYGADILVTHNLKDFQQTDLKPYNLRVLTPGTFIKEYF